MNDTDVLRHAELVGLELRAPPLSIPIRVLFVCS